MSFNKPIRVKGNLLLLSLFSLVLVAACSSQSPRTGKQDKTEEALVASSAETIDNEVKQTLLTEQMGQEEGQTAAITRAKNHKMLQLGYADSLQLDAAPTGLSEAGGVIASKPTGFRQMLRMEAPPALPQNENYAHLDENSVKLVANEPVSTFSIDVDTGSYSNVRRMLNQGALPPSDAVRIEEFINYFDYAYPQPEADTPFSIQTDLAVSPWHSERHLLRVALQGQQIIPNENKGKNLVFLLDVSGSMTHQNKLPLLKSAMSMLTKQLGEKDSVAIVVYAGASGVVLEPTSADQSAKIIQALNGLRAGGSTNGGAGIELAYNLAEQAFIKGGVNRVILATDGDFNVGIHDHQQLMDLIKRQRQKGIALTTLGFGQGNYNDHLMEQLADQGNGNYAYIDNINEARKVLVDELDASMHMIAKDVKMQVEFNPNLVAEYRLIGYENRKLNNEDFNNDKVDAGEIGAGHNVTAFYELTLHDSQGKFNDALRYTNNNLNQLDRKFETEIAQVKLRYKKPRAQNSQLLSQIVELADVKPIDQVSVDFGFATSVVAFAQMLKQSNYSGGLSYEQIINMANKYKGKDDFGYRGEFVQLVRTAKVLQETGMPDQTGKIGQLRQNLPQPNPTIRSAYLTH